MGEVGERALLREERPDPQLLECLCISMWMQEV